MQKIRKNNNKVNSNKAIHVKAEKKLNDNITFYAKLISVILRGVKLISTWGLTKTFISGYTILNGCKIYCQRWIVKIFSIWTRF